MIYNSAKQRILSGDINLTSDTLKVALLTNAYTPNADTHEFRSSITNEVANGNGYTTGGQTLSGKVFSKDNTADEGRFDADDLTWPGATFTARYALLYKDTGSPATSPVIAVFDFGVDKVSSGGDFIIQWNAEGLLNLN